MIHTDIIATIEAWALAYGYATHYAGKTSVTNFTYIYLYDGNSWNYYNPNYTVRISLHANLVIICKYNTEKLMQKAKERIIEIRSSNQLLNILTHMEET